MNLGSVGVVVSARTASKRLPGKSLLPLAGLPMVLFLMRRLKTIRGASLVLATTTLPSDDQLTTTVSRVGIPVFRGDPDDLINRYHSAANYFCFDTVVRVTADCPFIDGDLIEYCLQEARWSADWDLATTKSQFPVGLDAEIIPVAVIEKLRNHSSLSAGDREHLTLYLYNNNYKVKRIRPPSDWPETSGVYTVDTPADYRVAQSIVQSFKDVNFSVKELLLL